MAGMSQRSIVPDGVDRLTRISLSLPTKASKCLGLNSAFWGKADIRIVVRDFRLRPKADIVPRQSGRYFGLMVREQITSEQRRMPIYRLSYPFWPMTSLDGAGKNLNCLSLTSIWKRFNLLGPTQTSFL